MEERHGGTERHLSADDGLDSELAEALNHEHQMQVASTALLWTRVLMSSRKIRVTELEKQVRQLTSDASDKETKLALLQGQLDSAQEDSADQYKQVLQSRHEMSVLQSSLTEVRQGQPIEGSVSAVPLVDLVAYDVKSTDSFKRMREQVKAQQKQIVLLEEKLSSAQKGLEVAESDRMSSFENHCMLTDLTIDLFKGELVDKPKLQVVEEVRKQNSLAMRQLQGEHDDLRKRHNRLIDMFVDLTEERNDAWRESHEHLIAKGNIEAEADAKGQALQELTELVRQAAPSASIGHTKDIEIYASKIDQGRERLAKAQKVCTEVVPSDVAFETLSLSQQSSSPRSPSPSRLSSLNSSHLSSTSSSRFSRALSMITSRGG